MTAEFENGLPYGASVAAIFPDAGSKATFVRHLLTRRIASGFGAILQNAGEIGYVSQGKTLLSGFSVRDNVSIPSFFRKPLAYAEMHLRIRQLCRQGSIPHALLGRQTRQLSLIQSVQATYLQALASDPEVVVFDSVFEHLGMEERGIVSRLISNLNLMYPLRRTVFLGYELPSDSLYRASHIVTRTAEAN